MTPQEAIERLRKIPVRPKPDNALDMQAIIMAVKVLEKQMPKKPLEAIHTYKGCPRCKRAIDDKQLFCDRCGQALDWGDEE